MRLYEYIKDDTEDGYMDDDIIDDTIDDVEKKRILNMIRKDCKPFLKESSTYFTRSFTESHGVDNIRKIKPRKNRKPKDTPLYLHDILNNWFRSKFGWNVRSEGVFTYPGKGDFYGDSNIYYFFPIGSFKFVFSDTISDLYNTLDHIFDHFKHNNYDWSNLKDLNDKGDYVILDKIFNEFVMKYGKTYRNKNLKSISEKSANREHEVVFKCKEYYIINNNIIDKEEIKELFK